MIKSGSNTVLGVLFVALICIAALSLSVTGARDSTCLWKVSGNGKTDYIIGSIHLLSEEDYPLHEKLEQAFLDAAVLVFETDIDSANSLPVQQKLLANAVYKDGKTLKSELSDSTYSKLQDRLEVLGMSPEMLNTVRPWFVALTLVMLEITRLGFDPNLGLDRYFYDKAKSGDKAISALEAVEYQINLLLSFDDLEQEKLLIQTLTQLGDIERDLDTLLESWKEGNLAMIDSIMNGSLEEFPEIYEKLIVRRNLNWLGSIESFLNDDQVHLVIVGAAHLAGKKGLIELLADKGYHIVQM
jgi:uncharacterized protein YbaP (TraB family)